MKSKYETSSINDCRRSQKKANKEAGLSREAINTFSVINYTVHK